jgi:hypothetical protein
MKKWAIHTLFMSIILGFCQKIHAFSLPTSIGGFRGLHVSIMADNNVKACFAVIYINWDSLKLGLVFYVNQAWSSQPLGCVTPTCSWDLCIPKTRMLCGDWNKQHLAPFLKINSFHLFLAQAYLTGDCDVFVIKTSFDYIGHKNQPQQKAWFWSIISCRAWRISGCFVTQFWFIIAQVRICHIIWAAWMLFQLNQMALVLEEELLKHPLTMWHCEIKTFDWRYV